MKTLIACALIAVPAAVSAQDRAHTPQQVSAALKAGCAVQQTHHQTGRVGATPAIVRCPTSAQDQAQVQSKPIRLSDRR